MAADEPIVLEMWREEVREPFIQIIELAAGNRVVTTIEVLSPGNKTAFGGRSGIEWQGGERQRVVMMRP